MKLKGQYRVVREIILFAIGVAITSFVVISFSNVQTDVSELALQDHMAEVSSVIISGIIEVAESGQNSSVTLEIPEKISGEVYRITASNDELKLMVFDNPNIYVTQKLFNMSQTYFITGDIVSTSKFIKIELEFPNIVIKRA